MKTLRLVYLLVPLVLLSNSECAFADEDNDGGKPEISQVVQELFMSDMAFTQGKYEFQATASGEWKKQDSNSFNQSGLSLEFGITDWLQIGTQVPFRTSEGDPEELIGLGTMLQFYRGADLAVAGAFEMILPRKGQDREYEPSVSLNYSLDPVYLNLSVGAEIIKKGEAAAEEGDAEVDAKAKVDERDTTPFVTPGLVYVIGKFRPSVEIPVHFGYKTTAFLTPGVNWLPAKGVEVGIGLFTQIAGAEDSRLSGAKLNLTWEYDI